MSLWTSDKQLLHKDIAFARSASETLVQCGIDCFPIPSLMNGSFSVELGIIGYPCLTLKCLACSNFSPRIGELLGSFFRVPSCHNRRHYCEALCPGEVICDWFLPWPHGDGARALSWGP